MNKGCRCPQPTRSPAVPELAREQPPRRPPAGQSWLRTPKDCTLPRTPSRCPGAQSPALGAPVPEWVGSANSIMDVQTRTSEHLPCPRRARSQRRLLLLQGQRRRGARQGQRRELEQRGAAAHAGPLERTPAVHAARRRRPRVGTGQRPALRSRTGLAGGPGRGGVRRCVVGRGRSGARSSRAREPRGRRGLLGVRWPAARGRASGQRRVGARVTCVWTRGVQRRPPPAGTSPPTCC